MFSTPATIQTAHPGPRSRFPGEIALRMRTRTLDYFTELARTYGDVVSFRVARTHYLLLSDPAAIRDVLVTRADSFVKGPALRRARPALGDGLLTSEGDFHRRQRRLSQPAFHPNRVATYANAMVQIASQVAEAWREGEVFDVHREMMQLTLRIVAKTLFDAEVEREIDQLGQAMDVTVKMFTRALAPWGSLLNALPLPSNYRFKRAHGRLLATIDRMIADRRAGGPEKQDLLSLLLRARDNEANGADATGGSMNDRQLRDESLTLFTAGHETTANALTFSLYLLANHPSAQQKLHEELRTILGARLPRFEDVENLTFTRAVLSESMRLYPPAWALGRQATADVEAGGVRIPKETVVLMSQWIVHRAEKWWPRAEQFLPERWLDAESIAARPRWAFFPFGGGPRQCIGESFAWMESILVLATVCRNWRFELASNHPVRLLPTITLRPREGIDVRVLRWK